MFSSGTRSSARPAATGDIDNLCSALSGASISDAQRREFEDPVHRAAAAGGTVQQWVSAGASKDKQNVYGSTPMHYAALNGRLGALQGLLGAGADLNKRNNAGRTSLHLAAITGSAQEVHLLISSGESQALAALADF